MADLDVEGKALSLDRLTKRLAMEAASARPISDQRAAALIHVPGMCSNFARGLPSSSRRVDLRQGGTLKPCRCCSQRSAWGSCRLNRFLIRKG